VAHAASRLFGWEISDADIDAPQRIGRARQRGTPWRLLLASLGGGRA